MNPHPLIVRGSLQAAVAALVLSRLAMGTGRLADWFWRRAADRMRHAQDLADMATTSKATAPAQRTSIDAAGAIAWAYLVVSAIGFVIALVFYLRR